jgi:hypothetical protein
VINRCVQLPATSTNPVNILSCESVVTRVDLTDAGHTEDGQLRATPGRAAVWVVPDPQFPAKTPADHQSSTPASTPDGQPGSSPQPGKSSGERLRWARCRDDRYLHLLALADVITAAAEGHAQVLCGRWLPAEDLTITHGPPGTLCLSCLAGVSTPSADPDPKVGPPARWTQPNGGGYG